jgi:glycosyltransferase involved in cell wall biosynthesis
VIHDGGSVDGTVAVLRRYDHAVDWISEPDDGQSDALNKALQKARGRWVAWLNADEFYLPGGLAKLVRRGDATSADVVYGDVVFVDPTGRVARLLPQHPFSALILRLYGCYIPSSGTIFRRSSLPSNAWDVSLKMMMDWDLYLRLASQDAHFEKVNYPVAAFRRHAMQTTAHATDFTNEYARLFARYGISPASRRWGRWLHGLYKLASGAYLRQLRARRFSGLGLLWPRDPNDRAIFEELWKTCYPGPRTGWGR